MTDREKLIEILESTESAIYWNSEDKGFIQKIADHLLANGVTFAKDTNVPANPIVPGHDDQYNIAEMSYKNGYAKGCEDSKPKWLPVSERLPDVFGEFIVVVKAPTGEIYSDYADYDLFSKRWTTGLFFDIGSKITHWMPLPEPPEEE